MTIMKEKVNKCVQGEVEKHHPSGILTLYSVIYNDGDVGLLDPEETKKQVDLHNKMKKQVDLHNEMNDDYDEEIVKQEIELWEENGPKGVLLNKFCCIAFKNKGK